MGFSKDKFTLFFSLPLDALDLANLDASGCKQVMLPLGIAVAHPETIAALAARGIKLIVRCEEESYYNDNAPTRILIDHNKLSKAIRLIASIVGCEPENSINFQYGSPDWAGLVWEHRRRFDVVREVLQRGGYKVVSPGWTSRSISEDDKSQPGSTTWDEITRPVYDACDGNGFHYYGYGWSGPVDEWRIKTALKEAQRVRHKPLFIDELGVVGLGNVERMQCYVDIANLLLTHHLGARVEMLAPFVSNGSPGNPPVYPPGFILRDPKAYELLGRWMRS